MLEAVKSPITRASGSTSGLLTVEGVKAFLEDPSPEARIKAAAIVAAEFASNELSDKENELVLAIIEMLSDQGEVEVREALAEPLKSCPNLPQNVARRLASDSAESVAVPIIRCSPVLDDEDLIAVVESGPIAIQLAVAKREEVSPEVADALLATRNEKIIGALLANKGADLPERLLNRVIDEFGSFTSFHPLLVERPFLPLSVVARVQAVVGDEHRERLLDRQELPATLAQQLARVLRGTSINAQAAKELKAVDVLHLSQWLAAKESLPAVLVLRSLLTGDLAFFEAAFAAKADMTVEPTRSLIYSRSEKGFKGLYARCGLSSELARAFRVGIDFILEIGRREADQWRAEYTRELLKRLSNEFDDVCPTDLRRLIGRLQRRVSNENDQTKRGAVELAFSKAGRDKGAKRPAPGPLRPAS